MQFDLQKQAFYANFGNAVNFFIEMDSCLKITTLLSLLNLWLAKLL